MAPHPAHHLTSTLGLKSLAVYTRPPVWGLSSISSTTVFIRVFLFGLTNSLIFLPIRLIGRACLASYGIQLPVSGILPVTEIVIVPCSIQEPSHAENAPGFQIGF